VTHDDSDTPDERALMPFGPLFLDRSRVRVPEPRPRKAHALPGSLIPRFRRVGAFWLPEMWLYDQSRRDEVLQCPVRGRIVKARRTPAIDFESVLSLGEVVLADFLPGQDLRVDLMDFPFTYGLEVILQRSADGSGRARFEPPRAVLLIPRRKPLVRSDTPDARDLVEVVCVSEADAFFFAGPLHEAWRFAMAWGPNPPSGEALLDAMRRGDAAQLSPPDHFRGDNGQLFVRPLGMSDHWLMPPHTASVVSEMVLNMAREGFAVLSPHPDHRPPHPVARVVPGVDGGHGWLVLLLMQYGDLLLPPDGVPLSDDFASRAEFIVRDLISEDSARAALEGYIGPPEQDAIWLVSRREEHRLMDAIGALREAGWAFELHDEFSQAFGRRPQKRPQKLKTEKVFRQASGLPASEDAERVYQNYVAVRTEISEREALELSRDLDELRAAWDAQEAELAANGINRQDALDPEAQEAQRHAASRAFTRAINLSVTHQPRVHLAALVAKIGEVRRLRAVHQQDPETIEGCVAVAEQLMRDNGARLLAHQRDALRGILHRLHIGTGAILALPVGYGKTLVALLAAMCLRRLGVVSQPILWVGTKSTLVSLRGDLRTFLPALRCSDFTGPQRMNVELDDVDLVMTTYDLLRRDAVIDKLTRQFSGPLHERTWGLLVLDEYSVASNPVTSTFNAADAISRQAVRVLLLNATLLENTSVDLWSHLQMVSRGTYGGQWAFAAFDQLLLDADPTGDRARAMVRRDVFAYTVDERQCSDEDVHIPPLTWRPDLEVQNAPEHAQTMEHYRIAVRRYARSRRTGRRVIGDVGRLRRACHHLKFLGKDYAHFTAAPRAELAAQFVADEYAQGNHTLVFCTWTECVALIEAALRARGLKFDVLRGETSQADRTALAAKWGDGRHPPADTAAMLIQPVAGGRGLNLTGANRVLFTEPFWNPGLMRQNVGRAHRIRQVRPVEAQLLLSDAVIEQAVRRRAQAKAALAEAVFGGGRMTTTDPRQHWVDEHARLGGQPGEAPDEQERLAALEQAHAAIEVALERVRAGRAVIDSEPRGLDDRQRALEDLRIEALLPMMNAITRIGAEVPADGDELEALYAHLMVLEELLAVDAR
jgi:hypothetical protein